MEKIRIPDRNNSDPGSRKNIPDPQHIGKGSKNYLLISYLTNFETKTSSVVDPDPNPDLLVEAWIRGSGSTPKCHGSATLSITPIWYMVSVFAEPYS
jgi:hypothetical protein